MGLYLLKFPARKMLAPIARAARFIHPDIISYAATLITFATAYCFYRAGAHPGLLLWAIALTLLRMGFNTIDGVMAIQRGNLSLKGEIVNALPDRYSDLIYTIGIALSPLCTPLYGLLGIGSMVLVSYTGMLGKALGVDWQHHGPLGKVERLVLVMLAALWQYLQLRHGGAASGLFGLGLTPLEWCMILYLVLGQWTVLNRLRGMLRQIAVKEWSARIEGQAPAKRVLVAYDSMTGNTAKVAAALGRSLQADVRAIDTVTSFAGYDLVVFGSPNLRKRPTPKIAAVLEKAPELPRYAVFVTFGMPVWGQISTPACLRYFADKLGKAPLATFACKGYHAKYKTYAGHPSEDELTGAFLFGVRLARKLERVA